MDDLSNSLLGPAERHVAQEIRTALGEARTAARELADKLDELDESGVEAVLLDPERKQALIDSVGHLQKFVGNLRINALIPLVLGIAMKAKQEA